MAHRVRRLAVRPVRGGVYFSEELTWSALSPPRGTAGEFVTLVPEKGDAFLRVQRLAAGPAGCHLVVHVDEVVTAGELATSLGATPLRPPAFSSPGGFVFCIVSHHGGASVPLRPAGLTVTGAWSTRCASISLPGRSRPKPFFGPP